MRQTTFVCFFCSFFFRCAHFFLSLEHAWSPTLKPKAVVSLRMPCRLPASTEKALLKLPRSSDLFSVSKGTVSRPGCLLKVIRFQCNWAPGSGFLNNTEVSLTWRLARNALPLANWAFKVGLADMPDCLRCSSSQKETTLHAFYSCERVRPFYSHVGEWTACIDPKQLVLLDVGYVVDNIDPPYRGEKRVVFLAILAVARMVIWTTRKKGLYDGANFSHRDLIFVL